MSGASRGLTVVAGALAISLLGSCGSSGAGGDQQKPATYAVTYDGNGNTGGTVPIDSTRYTQGQTVTVMANTGYLVNAGYTFAGWNTQANGGGTDYAASGAVTFAMGSGNVVLYARWTGTEDCFNGVDDDGNGAIDCADPACVAVAECVPAAPGLAVGTLVADGTSCPTAFAAGSTSLGQGLVAPGTCVGCSCLPATPTCTTKVRRLSACGGTETAFVSISSGYCQALGFGTGSSYRVDALTVSSFCLAGGVASPTPASWTSRAQFCATAGVGGGCAAGYVCAPKATRHCAGAAGAVSCPAGYALEGGDSWYTGADDTRACNACSCGPVVGASCGTSSVHASGSSTSCTSYVDLPAGTETCSVGGLLSATVALSGTSKGACTPSSSASGAASPIGQQTICCVP